MMVLAFFVLVFTAIRLVVVFVNVLSSQSRGNCKDPLLVSVLIPARNEEQNIGKLLHSLITHDYPNLEILVYNDLSEDKTGEIARRFAQRDARVKVLEGVKLPEDWLGKNHACHQLALQAAGDYYLFLDADVAVKQGLISDALAHLQKHNLKLLSLFPVQTMHTFAERLTVPLMNWILVSLLPLILTRMSKRPSFSAANGQFMLFEAANYRQHQYHKELRLQKVEDIAIFRLMKKQGMRVQTMLGNQAISCRMYRTWQEAVQGFSKNVFEFFGGSRLLALLFGLITTFGIIPVLLGLPLVFTAVYLFMVILLRVLISLASRQNVLYNLLLAPLQQLSFLYVVFLAWELQRKKATLWKGRIIDL